MTIEKSMQRPTSPVHVHVDDDTPVHVHVKKPGQRKAKPADVSQSVNSINQSITPVHVHVKKPGQRKAKPNDVS